MEKWIELRRAVERVQSGGRVQRLLKSLRSNLVAYIRVHRQAVATRMRWERYSSGRWTEPRPEPTEVAARREGAVLIVALWAGAPLAIRCGHSPHLMAELDEPKPIV